MASTKVELDRYFDRRLPMHSVAAPTILVLDPFAGCIAANCRRLAAAKSDLGNGIGRHNGEG
jgi:hypothetical protein